jgi:hypothetical protein
MIYVSIVYVSTLQLIIHSSSHSHIVEIYHINVSLIWQIVVYKHILYKTIIV